MIRYQAQVWGPQVNAVEVVKETASFVTLLTGRREAKSSEYACWFATADEAWDYIVAAMERKVRAAELDLERHRAKLIAAMDARSKAESSVGASQ